MFVVDLGMGDLVFSVECFDFGVVVCLECFVLG